MGDEEKVMSFEAVAADVAAVALESVGDDGAIKEVPSDEPRPMPVVILPLPPTQDPPKAFQELANSLYQAATTLRNADAAALAARQAYTRLKAQLDNLVKPSM